MATALLTPRQSEVVALLRRGDTNKEIAGQLGISDDAVKGHLSRLYLRFGVSNRVALLNVLGSEGGRTLATGDLGDLRAIAGRLHESSSSVDSDRRAFSRESLESLRQALAAVDAALDLVGELPDATRGQLIDAVKRRIDSGLLALDELQRSLIIQSPSAAAR